NEYVSVLPTIWTAAVPVAFDTTCLLAGISPAWFIWAVNVCVFEEPPHANPPTIAASTAIRRIVFSPLLRPAEGAFPRGRAPVRKLRPGSLPQTDCPFQCRRSGWA